MNIGHKFWGVWGIWGVWVNIYYVEGLFSAFLYLKSRQLPGPRVFRPFGSMEGAKWPGESPMTPSHGEVRPKSPGSTVKAWSVLGPRCFIGRRPAQSGKCRASGNIWEARRWQRTLRIRPTGKKRLLTTRGTSRTEQRRVPSSRPPSRKIRNASISPGPGSVSLKTTKEV